MGEADVHFSKRQPYIFYFENVIGLRFINRIFCFCQKLEFGLILVFLIEVLMTKIHVDFGLWMLSFGVCALTLLGSDGFYYLTGKF